jgi:signal recognition particle subunit SRP54
MAERILGDVVSLVEETQEQFDEEEARKIQENRQKFGFDDFLSQIQQVKKMGNEERRLDDTRCFKSHERCGD